MFGIKEILVRLRKERLGEVVKVLSSCDDGDEKESNWPDKCTVSIDRDEG